MKEKENKIARKLNLRLQHNDPMPDKMYINQELEERVTHAGLAKFIIGCITKQVKISRAMHRTKGHCASVGLNTAARSPPMSC